MDPDPARVKHIEQTEYFWCGAASAEMVLRFETPNLDDQKTLFNQNTHDPATVAWFSTPEGIADTLRDRVDASKYDRYQVKIVDSEEGISRKICWAIAENGEAPILLVYGRAHWIVCTSYLATQPPGGVDDPGYQIEYMFVNNPYMKRSVASPDEDMLEFVPYHEWQRHYVSYPVPPNEENEDYKGKFIAISDIEDAGSFPYTPYLPTITGNPIASVADAETGANAVIMNDTVFSSFEPWKSFQGNVEVYKTFLMEDTVWGSDETYFVTYTWTNAANPEFEIPLIVRMAARDTTEFRGAVAVPKGSAYVKDHPEMLDREAVQGKYFNETFTNEETGKSYLFQNGTLQPNLFWRPCLESLSPYLPFYRVTFIEEDEQGPVEFYIRLDGVVFYTLHFDEAVGA
jgi:hypothetical protein